METLQSQKYHIILLLTIFLQFSSLLLQSSGYTLPDHYFINCGSDSNATYGGNKVFVSDSSFFSGQNQAIKDDSNTSSVLYQTARVFHGDRSSYHFEIKETATHIVRLHFFAFSSAQTNLSDALFNVRADEFSLLSNFSISQSSNSPVKEFLLTIPTGFFSIQFIPSKSSFAFVNAIEVFLAPENFIPDNATHISSARLSNSNYSGVHSQALQTIYRINVGGSTLTAENDPLLREWILDDDFLLNSKAETSSPPAKDVQLWNDILTNKYIAPASVYRTARALNLSGNSNVSSIRWRFSVTKNASYLVRFHFYDIVSTQVDSLRFNLHIYSFIKYISPYDLANRLISPFFLDFIVDSEDSGFINISISKNDSSTPPNAFLNGLEIMEIKEPLTSKGKKHIWFILGGSFGGVFVLASMAVIFLVFRLRRGKLGLSSGWSGNLFTHGGGNASLPPDLNLELKISYSEIKRATKRFNKKLVIGEGGFGKVYKGSLRNNAKVAVKRSEPGHGQGFLEFQAEIVLLSRIRHRHLVSLIGYCMERSEMILVYEFMEKGTLREHLYVTDGKSQTYSSKAELSWEERLKICVDAAKGLHYLHTGLANRIIHRDIKSTNILLSEDYTAKVADFGLSKSGLPDQEQEMTANVKGSFGYMDPECFMTLQFTEKSDVYSFGVVLFEVLCARPAILNTDRKDETSLADWGIHWQRQGRVEEIIDPALTGTINASSLKKFGETAEKCLRASSSERPVMRDVLWDLQFALRLQETAGNVELAEETMVTNAFGFSFQAEDQLPSLTLPVEVDDADLDDDHSSVTMASGVFSQLKIDGGR